MNQPRNKKLIQPTAAVANHPLFTILIHLDVIILQLLDELNHRITDQLDQLTTGDPPLFDPNADLERKMRVSRPLNTTI